MTVGRVLSGRYELLRIIGRGGMAEVYAARDLTLDREVAVKLLLERFVEDQGFTRRFQDEARHVARLNHPNLVAVYDTGNDYQQPYIVMELVHGRSLQEVIDAGGLTEDRALEVMADVCDALAYAHDHGLVHRDVKPGNILLADDGAVKVADFGIARAVGNETVTRTAAVLGTAAYLSPEQAQGLEIDPRSDLYSLGVVLYETLTGTPPFAGGTPITVAYQHVQEAARPPRQIDPTISQAAEAIVMRALAKNPANRYQHARDMHDDLVQARLGGPVAAPAVLTDADTALLQPLRTEHAVRGTRWEQRRRVVGYVVLILVTIAAMAAAVWLVLDLLQRDNGPEQVVVPDVVGESEATARELLGDRNLRVVVTTEVDDGPSGVVLRQQPAADTTVDENTTVNLVVSVGRDMALVPDLEGETVNTALGLLREAGLFQGTQDREYHNEVEEGLVISQSPPAGAEVPAGSTVSFVVSRGPELVNVRPVVRRSEEDAIERLQDQGLEPAIEQDFSDTIAEGFVISQDPTAGTPVPVGSIVTIVVSRGPEQPETPPDPCPWDPDIPADHPECVEPAPEPEPEPLPDPCPWDPSIPVFDPACTQPQPPAEP